MIIIPFPRKSEIINLKVKGRGIYNLVLLVMSLLLQVQRQTQLQHFQ